MHGTIQSPSSPNLINPPAVHVECRVMTGFPGSSLRGHFLPSRKGCRQTRHNPTLDMDPLLEGFAGPFRLPCQRTGSESPQPTKSARPRTAQECGR